MQRTCLLLTIVLALHAPLPAQSAPALAPQQPPANIDKMQSADTNIPRDQAVQPQAKRPDKPFSSPADINGRVINPSCLPDSALEAKYIRVRRAVMSPKEASDAFGRRLGRHYIVYQVTVENTSTQYQYMLHNVSMDLSNLYGDPSGMSQYSFSSQELSMLRGVPEKGQDYDPRNLTFHIMRGTGAVAGGVTGLTSAGIQDVFGGAVAAYNGPGLSAFLDIFPDHTATQLNRLSDSAFQANSVVPRLSAKVFAIFIPANMLLNNSDSKKFWNDPLSILKDPTHDFRKANLCVDGAFITELSPLPLTSVAVVSPATLTAGVSADLLVTGSALVPGDTSLVAFGQTIPLASISQDGKTGHATLTIPNDYDAKLAYAAYTESAKTGQQSQPVTITLAPPK